MREEVVDEEESVKKKKLNLSNSNDCVIRWRH